MAQPYSFTVPGRPVPAVRMTQRGKWVKTRAQRYLAYKNLVSWTAVQVILQPLEGPVGIEVEVYGIGKGRIGDLDNIVKAVMDGLNGVAWHDDSQVVEIRARRNKSDLERVEVKVWRVEEVS